MQDEIRRQEKEKEASLGQLEEKHARAISEKEEEIKKLKHEANTLQIKLQEAELETKTSKEDLNQVTTIFLLLYHPLLNNIFTFMF